MWIVDVVAAILFVASSGILFNKKFRENCWLMLFAGGIALVSTAWMTVELTNWAVDRRLERVLGERASRDAVPPQADRMANAPAAKSPHRSENSTDNARDAAPAAAERTPVVKYSPPPGDSSLVWWWWILPAIVGLCGLALLLRGFDALFLEQWFEGGRGLFGGSLLVTLASVASLLGFNVQTYSRLTFDRPVVEVSLRQISHQLYRATLEEPNGRIRDYEIHGDDWRIEARVLRWKPWANVLGLDDQYRLERVVGHYENVEQERTGERSDYAIGEVEGVHNGAIDVWSFSRLFKHKSPFALTLYGSAGYMPMVNNGEYEVVITRHGLLTRPKNGEAQAVASLD